MDAPTTIEPRAQVEHQGRIGPQNSHVLDSMARAYACALDLAGHGLTVLSIEAAGRNPVVWVDPARAAQTLRGAAKVIRSRGIGPRERLMVARHQGCQVQWHARD